MKYLKYILAISVSTIVSVGDIDACGPYYPDDPATIRIFRSCTPELESQWQSGCRFQEYEKDENCRQWQKITSASIPLRDIEAVVYSARLSDFDDLSDGRLAGNRFAYWLSKPEHSDDLQYLMVAKEIEEIREYMTDPWYYAYDGDDEHVRLEELKQICMSYSGRRHAARYALQLVRFYFAVGDYGSSIDLWENTVSKMPQDIVTDMIASYAGGAYLRKGERDKAKRLFTRSQDIGSLINMGEWYFGEEKSQYKDSRVRELEYIFNQFPNSPLLSVLLQKYVRERERYEYKDDEYKKYNYIDAQPAFYGELKRFALNAASSPACKQKGMWHYALGFLYYLDGDVAQAGAHLKKAEQQRNTPFIAESIKAFRFLFDADTHGLISRPQLFAWLKWLDECLARDVNLSIKDNWQYDNKMNYPFYYWQDVARRVFLGKLCPKFVKNGNAVLALQLANYAVNRIHQLAPLYEAWHYNRNESEARESNFYAIITLDDYRKNWTGFNEFDYQNDFFQQINKLQAAQAAEYCERIATPATELDRFLNDRSYVDSDYICDIVGTLYMREMNYDKAVGWLQKVSQGYQKRTNVAKEGYFRLDPFRFQYGVKQFIADSSDYKLRFAQKMLQLKQLIDSPGDPDRRANAKIRYAVGLRNSFGICWYLTEYGYGFEYGNEDFSYERGGWKNPHAQKAYKKVDKLMADALNEFTDPEQAARAHIEMMNLATLMKKYPDTQAAKLTRCDNYHDYALHKR